VSPARANLTDPAHAILYEPANLAPPADPPDTGAILARVESVRANPFNDRQRQALARSFTERISLLWGPPGPGKTTVLAAIVLGWLERAWSSGAPVTIGVGASNYNAIDNLLSSVADLLEQRASALGEPPIPTTIARVRSSYSEPPSDPRIVDVERNSPRGSSLAEGLDDPTECVVVGGTWMQLEKLAKGRSEEEDQTAPWFDLLLIDEASQVGVAHAAAYFLLLTEEANVVLAGDHRQLGPIYGFQVDDTEGGLFECIFTYMQDTHGVVRTALDTNYRTNDEIAAWPRERFYGEGYEAFSPERRLELTLPGPTPMAPEGWPEQLPWTEQLTRILDPALPVAVVTYAERPYTLSNPFEAQMVAALTLLYRRALEHELGALAEEDFWGERLGIVTPHRAQMSSVRNLLEIAAGTRPTSLPFVDTVDRFQGQERDLIVASYTVADRDFVASEAEFILDPRRFNVTLTRARSKFVMFVSDAVVEHLPSDAEVARGAAHLQLFVEDYCSAMDDRIILPFSDRGCETPVPCWLRGHE
jgi:hypothetical protein